MGQVCVSWVEMGVVRRNVHKLSYALITAALVATFAATTVGGIRLHHAAVVERQTIRTQRLETALLERNRAMLTTEFAAVAAHDPAEAARLRPAYQAYLGSPATRRPFELRIEAELTRQAAAIRRANPAARAALITGAVGAGVLVLLLVWLFELERRAGRIDRDNAARAEELMRLRNEFVAVVSHELRTPLTSIIGYLELMSEGEGGDLTAEQAGYLAVVQRSTNRLADLVGDLLLVAETERGPLALERVETDLGSIAAHAVEAARPAADARSVVVLLENGGGTIHGDPTRLAQMLDNLVSNAIKFTPEGGRVIVRATADGHQAVVEVADTGEGVADGDRDRLFDPFFRSREANARAVPGTGLGLTITKAIVDAHGGTVQVGPAPGGGTIFRVRIPVGERAAVLSRL
jgi:signal transduction histidine kinase